MASNCRHVGIFSVIIYVGMLVLSVFIYTVPPSVADSTKQTGAVFSREVLQQLILFT
jgi:hypothetical protein